MMSSNDGPPLDEGEAGPAALGGGGGAFDPKDPPRKDREETGLIAAQLGLSQRKRRTALVYFAEGMSAVALYVGCLPGVALAGCI